MLEQEQLVADPAVGPFRGQPTLEGVGFAVLDTAEPRGMERGGPDGIEDGRGHRRTIAGRASRSVPGRSDRDAGPGLMSPLVPYPTNLVGFLGDHRASTLAGHVYRSAAPPHGGWGSVRVARVGHSLTERS